MTKTKTLPKTHWKKLYNPNYMGAWSLNEGQEKILTIKSVLLESVKGMKGRSEECTVIYWNESEKPFILNKTNAKNITKSVGSPYIEDWAGRKIKLYIDHNVEAFGDIVDALRVRPTAVKVEKEEMNPSHPRWAKAMAALHAGETTLDVIKGLFILSIENEKIMSNAKVV